MADGRQAATQRAATAEFAAGIRATASTEGVVLRLGDAVHGAVQPAHVSLWRPATPMAEV